MNRLQDLQEIADRQLGGLKATSNLLANIRLQAAAKSAPKPRQSIRPIFAVCLALLLCIGAFGWAVDSAIPGDSTPVPSLLDSQPAGGNSTQQTSSQGDLRALQDVPPGNVSIGTAVEAPVYRSIFAEAKGGNFPMVSLNGATYRMLKSPSMVSSDLLGESLGEIAEYTLEPALSDGGIVSNIASQGEAVYAITGMKGAMIAANVGGTMRAFQRVSFAGSAIIGNESLADTLCDPADVLWMELSDVGAIDDSVAASSLMATLLDNASYQSASVSSSGSQSLLIGLKNGMTLQLMKSGDSVSACGTWSCPEFFEAFAVAMEP